MKIQAVRGMQDLLPAQKKISRTIEDVVREVLAAYGYREIGLPQLAQTELQLAYQLVLYLVLLKALT